MVVCRRGIVATDPSDRPRLGADARPGCGLFHAPPRNAAICAGSRTNGTGPDVGATTPGPGERPWVGGSVRLRLE